MEKNSPQEKSIEDNLKSATTTTTGATTITSPNITRDTIITKESLRPPCKRQRTRSIAKQDCADQKETPSTVSNEAPVDVSDGTVTSTNPEHERKCRRRQWEQWSFEDQERFFQSLGEFGKDFTKIQAAMRKRKGRHVCEPKTKEQIRHYYHRTWAKIAKNLKLPPEIDPKKAYRREIHYMVCLGELRKKGALGFGPKVMQKLDELVKQGCTNVRHKSRNLRVRPPNRFLRKLYDSTFPLLPKQINIEFLPHTNSAFNFIQKHAFNPRLRFVNVNINAKFSEVFEMFDRRFADLCTDNSLELYIYPIHMPNKGSTEFTRILTQAKDQIATQESDTPITLEEVTKTPSPKTEGNSSTDEEETFPKIFGKKKEEACDNSETDHSNIKPFPGYWTVSSAEQISLSTLFLALGENELLKFKYEWKLKEPPEPSLHANCFQIFRNICSTKVVGKNEVKKELEETIKPEVCTPESAPVIVPGIIPLRPRPGRRATNKPTFPANRYFIPASVAGTNKLLNNAVAVNLIPQPRHLLQFAQMLPGNTKLVNNGSSTVGLFNASEDNSGVVVTEATSSSKDYVYEEVVEEGCNAEFNMLENLLTTLKQGNTEANSDVINTNANTSSRKIVDPPKSPNLEWLNGESVDLSMTSFLNVDRQQREQLQNELAAAVQTQSKVATDKPTLKKEINDFALKANHDPTLPEFHSGDTNGSLFSMNFS